MKKIRERAAAFRKRGHKEHRALFEHLADGQQPEALFITCSDSRIQPSLVTETLPGELFLLRNAGNFVQRHDAGPHAEAAAIEYAVEVLGVEHIVICGHSRCGAVAAALDPDSAAGLPAVRDWLAAAGPDLAAVTATDSAERLDAAIRLNVRQQLENLRTHPAVRKGEDAGSLELHGWVYEFETGNVFELDPATGHFIVLDSPSDRVHPA